MNLTASIAASFVAASVAMAWTNEVQAANATFDVSPLPPIHYANFFSDGRNGYDIDSPIDLSIIQKTEVDDRIRNGIEIRIFSLQPTEAEVRNGTANKVQPQVWAHVGGCRVYLSLVFRPDRDLRQHMLNSHQLEFGPLTASAGWLSIIDRDQTGWGYYLMVVEPSTKADEPSVPDAGGLGMRYEFMRLTDETKDTYFKQGLFFAVSSKPAIGGIAAPFPELARDVAAFDATAHSISHSLHCYRSETSPAYRVSSIAAMQVAMLEPCVPSGPSDGSPDLGALPSASSLLGNPLL